MSWLFNNQISQIWFILQSQFLYGFQSNHHFWMKWLEATIVFDGFAMVYWSPNHHARWFSMVVHHRSNDVMRLYHRSSLFHHTHMWNISYLSSIVEVVWFIHPKNMEILLTIESHSKYHTYGRCEILPCWFFPWIGLVGFNWFSYLCFLEKLLLQCEALGMESVLV